MMAILDILVYVCYERWRKHVIESPNLLICMIIVAILEAINSIMCVYMFVVGIIFASELDSSIEYYGLSLSFYIICLSFLIVRYVVSIAATFLLSCILLIIL